ncbi:hypothetical protein SVIOM342S_10129 [Streptomyces violaceorubidus]
MSTRRWHVHAMKRAAALAGCTALVLSLTAATAEARPGHHPRDTARQTLPAGDGWASHGTGTTGGAAADAERVYTVSTWAEFRAALAVEGTAPRIIKVEGTVDAVSEGCEAFAAPGYDFGAYLEKYSPESWGRETDLSAEPDDSPEGLRRASAAEQDRSIKANVPSNTTIVGVGRGAALKGASLQIKDVDNVIVRNLTFESPVDCFPQWDPTDGDKGNWNSEYDSAVVHGSTDVWLGPQHLHRRRAPRQRGAHLLRHALPAARRPAGHRHRRGGAVRRHAGRLPLAGAAVPRVPQHRPRRRGHRPGEPAPAHPGRGRRAHPGGVPRRLAAVRPVALTGGVDRPAASGT